MWHMKYVRHIKMSERKLWAIVLYVRNFGKKKIISETKHVCQFKNKKMKRKHWTNAHHKLWGKQIYPAIWILFWKKLFRSISTKTSLTWKKCYKCGPSLTYSLDLPLQKDREQADKLKQCHLQIRPVQRLNVWCLSYIWSICHGSSVWGAHCYYVALHGVCALLTLPQSPPVYIVSLVLMGKQELAQQGEYDLTFLVGGLDKTIFNCYHQLTCPWPPLLGWICQMPPCQEDWLHWTTPVWIAEKCVAMCWTLSNYFE